MKKRVQTTKPRAYLGAVCAKCHSPILVTPCTTARCPRWVSVCECREVRRHFTETDGTCEFCRTRAA